MRLAFLLVCLACTACGSLRPPSVPLLLQSPEINLWSNADSLQSAVPTRWEGSAADWVAMARVNEQSFLLMGTPSPPWTALPLQIATQTSVTVRSTRTIYTFTAARARINITFTSPLLLDDWELLSRPAHYVTVSVASDGSSPCDVQIYFDVTAQVVVRDASTSVQFFRVDIDPSSDEQARAFPPQASATQQALRMGGQSQSPLSDAKDTPNWGDIYLTVAAASPNVQLATTLNWVRTSAAFHRCNFSQNHVGDQHSSGFLFLRNPSALVFRARLSRSSCSPNHYFFRFSRHIWSRYIRR